MKKLISVLTVLAIGLSSMFALEVKSYFTGAYSRGVFTERSGEGTSKLTTNAIDLSIASYFNGNWGLYLNTDYNFVSKSETITSGNLVYLTSANWNSFMILSGIIGPTYKYNINDNLELFGALGFHLAQTSMRASYATMLNYSYGIGGDIGIRYLPAKNIYITGGCLFSHDFASKGESYVSGYGKQTVNGAYNFGSFRPYIGIGITFTEHLN